MNNRNTITDSRIYEFTLDIACQCAENKHVALQVYFRDDVLAELARNKGARSSHGQALEKKYRQRIQQIASAMDERDFYALKSLHYEKLKGDRSHQFSMRLNDKYRLILEYEGEAPNKKVFVVAIEDYH